MSEKFRKTDEEHAHSCHLCDARVRNLLAVASNVVINWKGNPDRLGKKLEDLRRTLLSMGPDVKAHFEALGDTWSESPYITGALPTQRDREQAADRAPRACFRTGQLVRFKDANNELRIGTICQPGPIGPDPVAGYSYNVLVPSDGVHSIGESRIVGLAVATKAVDE